LPSLKDDVRVLYHWLEIFFFKICSRIGITDFCFIVELEYCIFKLHTMIVTFYENNELNRNWNSLFDDIFECNNLIKIENATLDLCCTVRLFWIAFMVLKHSFIQQKMNWKWRYILKPKEEVFVSDAENCYQIFLLNVIFL